MKFDEIAVGQHKKLLMKSIQKRYYQTLLILMPVMCAVCIGLSFWAIHNAESVYASETYKQIYAIKQTFLKDTVQNVIREIETYRKSFRHQANERLEQIVDVLDEEYRHAPGNLEIFAKHFLKRHGNSDRFVFRITDNHGKTILSNSAADSDRQDASLLRHLNYGALTIDLGLNETYVDNQTKAAIRTLLHGKEFQEDSYIWVNEIVNFSGGENYAIRRIHPNLKDTEGMYLSTDLKDIKGNTPYRTELEGIRKAGEVFSTYWFKRKRSQEIAEKLSYAAFYKDFNWVVAMGIPLEDIRAYSDTAKKSGKALSSEVIVIALTAILALFLSGLWVLSMMQKRYMLRTEVALREESNKDPLTGIYNRRIADLYLKGAFQKFEDGINNPALFFFDIDDFKKVNDTWGHKAGDLVLKTVVEQVSQIIRSDDLPFRWGGEEFLIIAEGVSLENAKAMAVKLNTSIAQRPIPISTDGGSVEIKVTISIGITWFNTSDHSPEEALHRADYAQYLAKKDGKNCVRVG